jgi:hypothetical protein
MDTSTNSEEASPKRSNVTLYLYIFFGTIVYQWLAIGVFHEILGWPRYVAFFVGATLFLIGSFAFNQRKTVPFLRGRALTFQLRVLYSIITAAVICSLLALVSYLIDVWL